MNADQRSRFDHFFAAHYVEILDAVIDVEPSGAVQRTRSGFASAYRFWGKVEDDGDPVGWVMRVIAEARRSTGRRRPTRVAGSTVRPATSADLTSERRRVTSLARRQRVIASAVIGTSAFAVIGAELLVAHR